MARRLVNKRHYEEQKAKRIAELEAEAERHMRRAEEIYAHLTQLEDETYEEAVKDARFDEFKESK